jgi:hypothetical protein
MPLPVICTAEIPYLNPVTGNVFVRLSPSDNAEIIGTFFGKIQTGQDASGNPIYREPYPNRTVAILGYYDPNPATANDEWYLIEFNGSRAWIFDHVIDQEGAGCTFDSGDALPNAPVQVNYVSPLPLTTAPDGLAPNPRLIQPPFGECNGESNDQDRRRCSYEVYVALYDHLADGDGLRLRDVLSVVMMYEVGIYFDGADPDNLIARQQYMAEAITRNLSQVCGDARDVTPDGDLACDMNGMVNWLYGLHGWYDQHPNIADPDIILFTEDPEANPSRDYEQYADLSMHLLQQSTWLNGYGSTSPFTWGNWASVGDSAAGYTAVNGNIETHGTGSQLDCAEETACPFNNIFYAAVQDSGVANCELVFAVTVRAHGFGQTGTCD